MFESMGIPIVFSLIIAYLLGSIPWASLITKTFYGMDITKMGSGNPGMTNVLRTLGWKPALPVALLDAGKGFLSALIAIRLTGSINWALLAGLFAVLGHSFTVFAKFKGGKSVLTGFGVFLYFAPIGALAGLGVWIVIVALTRYVSLGSIMASIVMPTTIFLQYQRTGNKELFGIFGVCILVCLFVLIRHKSNIIRLVNGTENKFGKKSK